MVGMALAKSIYAVPTRTRLVALVTEHASLRAAVSGSTESVPSVYACYRFTAKLRAAFEPTLDALRGSIRGALRRWWRASLPYTRAAL
jgi:phosphohistidine swiveling domain-containing protein